MEERNPTPKKLNPLLFLLIGGLLVGMVMACITAGGLGILFGAGSIVNPAIFPTSIPDLVKPGKPAPDFTTTTLEGETVSLTDYRGKVVALNFWATWCAPCEEEMPDLQAAADRYPDQLVVLAVNVGESPEEAQVFADRLGLTFPILLDEKETIADLYGVFAFPTTVWITAEGNVHFEHIGMLTASLIEDYLDALDVRNE